MQRHRFYAPPTQINGAQITLAADEAHHLARVLRLPIGAQVYVFDGCGNEYLCEIAHLDKHVATLNVIEPLTNPVESPLRLTLAQALIKGDKFDWVVQKATELGVTCIIPLITEHSDIRRAEERAENKLQRWRRIALEAVKQCGRRQLVEIAEPTAWTKFTLAETVSHRLFFSERGGRRFADYGHEQSGGPPPTSIILAIGPEGGWSEAELKLTEAGGWDFISLGPRILRTETAALSALVLAQEWFGDI
jgi:16S rRNA (uracil1498-N3)-methyltransferase